jgi:hypothetical protein
MCTNSCSLGTNSPASSHVRGCGALHKCFQEYSSLSTMNLERAARRSLEPFQPQRSKASDHKEQLGSMNESGDVTTHPSKRDTGCKHKHSDMLREPSGAKTHVHTATYAALATTTGASAPAECPIPSAADRRPATPATPQPHPRPSGRQTPSQNTRTCRTTMGATAAYPPRRQIRDVVISCNTLDEQGHAALRGMKPL